MKKKPTPATNDPVAKKAKATPKKTTPATNDPVVKKAKATPKTTGIEIPPQSGAEFRSMFVAQPDPVNKFFYNSDQAYSKNPEEAERMWADLAIFSALEERQLATAELPFNILPFDEDQPEQQAAAEQIEKVIKRTPYLSQFLRCLLDAIFWGKSAVFIEYKFDFSLGINKKRLIVNNWVPVAGDSMIFGEDQKLLYRIGSPIQGVTGEIIQTVEGRGKLIDEDMRAAWIVHSHSRQAGNFHDVRSAGNIFGVGLRSRLFPTWYLKNSLLSFYVQNAEKFGAGWVIAYFQQDNPASYQAVKEAMQKQVGSSVLMFPRSIGTDAPEGIEAVNPPSGSNMFEAIQYFDDQIRTTICGQNLTAEAGPTGLGSNLADVHQNTFGKRVRFDALALQETLSQQFVKVLQKENGFEHLPPLRWEFSFDLGNANEKIEKAQQLHGMGIDIAHDELRQEAGFTNPLAEEATTDDVAPK